MGINRMLKYSALILAIGAISCSCSNNAKQQIAENDNWGEISNGLQCRVSLSPGLHTIPGDYEFMLEIQNTTDKDITLPYEPAKVILDVYSAIYIAPFCRMNINKMGAKEEESNAFTPYIKEYSKSVGYNQIIVPKHGIWSNKLRISISVSGLLFYGKTPGKYSCTFLLGSSNVKDDKYWNGKTKSNTIIFSLK